MAVKDDVAVRNLDTWQAESAWRGIASVVARNHAQWLVTFQWFDSFRTGVSPIRCTKRWDGADLTPNHRIIVLLTKTGPRCISFRCKITVSLAQGAVHDAEADVADPVFVRSTIWCRIDTIPTLGADRAL